MAPTQEPRALPPAFPPHDRPLDDRLSRREALGLLALLPVLLAERATAGQGEGATSAPPTRPLRLRVVASGALDGELEPCGCPGGAAGGFARRAAALQWLSRTRDPWLPAGKPRSAEPILALDTGNALLKVERTRGQVGPAEEAHARRVGRLLAACSVRAVAVGLRDLLALKVEGLQGLARETQVGWLSANLEYRGSMPFPPSFSLTVQGCRVAVLGVTAAQPGLEDRLKLRIRDPLEVLPPLLEPLARQHDLVLVLANDSAEQVQRLAALKHVDMILSGGEVGSRLEQWGRTPPWGVLLPGAGRSLGIVDFRLAPRAGAGLPTRSLLPNGAFERRMLEKEGHEQALLDLIAQLKQEEGKVNPVRLEREGAWLRQKLEQLEQDPPNLGDARIFSARLLSLDGGLGEDASLLSRIR